MVFKAQQLHIPPSNLLILIAPRDLAFLGTLLQAGEQNLQGQSHFRILVGGRESRDKQRDIGREDSIEMGMGVGRASRGPFERLIVAEAWFQNFTYAYQFKIIINSGILRIKSHSFLFSKSTKMLSLASQDQTLIKSSTVAHNQKKSGINIKVNIITRHSYLIQPNKRKIGKRHHSHKYIK